MKFLGKEIKETDKGYFGVRRCTICNEKLRDVNLVEISSTSYFCFIPIRRVIIKRILVCQHCKAYMEIDNKLWEYYSTYYHQRFNKTTTDTIVNTLQTISNSMKQNGFKLDIGDETCQQSLDLIYKSLCDKYGVFQNVEEIISVFYKRNN
ncbi:MAG: hypothetical protein IJ458_02015 [Clostridia bacterium]|nr:hypothetical protein [Clostridia bacterium]